MRCAFGGHAAFGYCAAKSQWYWGMRLLLITDRRGAPVGYDLRPANENEREGVFQLASAHPDTVLFADAGHRGREHHASPDLAGVQLIVPESISSANARPPRSTRPASAS